MDDKRRAEHKKEVLKRSFQQIENSRYPRIMRPLAPSTRLNIETRLQNRESFSKICSATGVSKGSVSNIKKQLECPPSPRKAGRKPVVTQSERRLMVRLITAGGCDTAVEVQRHRG